MRNKGFTLIEVLVVAVIVAVLAAVAIPAYNGYILGSKQKVATNTAATIASSAAAYYSENPDKTKADIDTRIAAASTAGSSITGIGGDVKLPASFKVKSSTGGLITIVDSKDADAIGTAAWY